MQLRLWKKIKEMLQIKIRISQTAYGVRPIGYWPVQYDFYSNQTIFYVWWVAPFALLGLITYNVCVGIWHDLFRFNRDVKKWKGGK